MAIDFSKLKKSTDRTILDPTKIFDILPEKNDKYDGYLRDVQSEVLKKWFLEARSKKDTVIKMNTGSGKTVVGLLILQSYLNENKGPCVYVVPDNYLLEQVKQEADDLKIHYTTEENDINFINGKSILIINMYKLYNGKSVFGIGDIVIPINCIVFDDAHRSIDIAKDQVTLSIPESQPEYDLLFDLFKECLKDQSESTLLEIESGSYIAQQPIPFWIWQNNYSQILKTIFSMAEKNTTDAEREMFFKWPLVKDQLKLADCYISGKEISISLPFVPIDKIVSFIESKHRIFMSATLEDDTNLITNFNVDQDYQIISPQKANDIGERLVLIPQSKNTKITDDHMKKYMKRLSIKHNVVVLVPSYYRSSFWEDVADLIVENGEQLDTTVKKLKQSHLGLVIIVNRYDGIDLPKKACEILVIDSLPDSRTLKDKYTQTILRGTSESDAKNIRTIEQGMGRAARSKDDYCVIFIMNHVLIKQLYVNNSIQYFSESTRKQIELSDLIQDQIEGNDYNEIISYVLSRNPKWITSSKEYIADVEYNNNKEISQLKLSEKYAYTLASNGDYSNARTELQKLINESESDIYKAYLKYKLAKVTNFISTSEAQKLVKSANRLNYQLPKPISGIEYSPLKINNANQVQRLRSFIHDTYKDKNEYLLSINAIIADLNFNNVSYNSFEQAIYNLGVHIGLISQRPENLYGKGPDNLWLSYNDYNMVIECKNEATASLISKNYCNQLNGSIEWFKNTYGEDLPLVPIMIHPSRKFENAASPNRNIKIINEEKLIFLREKFKSFSEEIADSNFDVTTIEKSMCSYKLSPHLFSSEYTFKFK